MNILEDNNDPIGTSDDATQEESKENQVKGSDADADQNIGKFNTDTSDDPEKEIKGSDADTDHAGESSI